jgi:hypothetical protein
MKDSKCLSCPLSFYATQNNYPIFNSMISTNHDKVKRLSAYGEKLIKGIVYLL